MKHKRINRIAALLLTLILTAVGIYTAPAAASDVSVNEYIIKRKDAADRCRMDRGVPFEVVSEAEMIRLRDAGLLEWYEPDLVTELPDAQTDGFYDETEKWDLAMINADPAFSGNTVGQGVRVGVVDSGINPHPALNDSLLPGCNYMDGADASETSDRYGHGTLVAGLIAGKDDNGCLGAAHGAELVPLKITDGKSVSVSTVCRAIYGGIDNYGCGILNLSLGIRVESQALKEAVEYAEQKGVVIVSAVGNNGNAALLYPACYETVIGVGAVDETGAVYYKSNQNDSVFLTAPGANVKTTGRVGGYINASGTSFAVPHVTAAAAVLRGIDPELTPKDVRELLSRTAADRGAKDWDKGYGWGIVNIGESVLAMTGDEPDPDDPPIEDPTNDDPCPRDETCPLSGFSDLDVNAWYHDGVHLALNEGVMVGTDEKTFSPGMTTTRAMLVTMLWSMEGKPEPEKTESVFTDVKAGSWYEKAVLWAAQEELTAGTSEATFSPDAKLTREQLATFFFRFAEYKGADQSADADLSGFADEDSISGYARRAVEWSVAVGIISGISETTLSPQKSAVRAEVAAMLMHCVTHFAG